MFRDTRLLQHPVASVLCSLHGCTRAKFARHTVPGHDCEMIIKEAPCI